jgi:hypothetical protein
LNSQDIAFAATAPALGPDAVRRQREQKQTKESYQQPDSNEVHRGLLGCVI